MLWVQFYSTGSFSEGREAPGRALPDRGLGESTPGAAADVMSGHFLFEHVKES